MRRPNQLAKDYPLSCWCIRVMDATRVFVATVDSASELGADVFNQTVTFSNFILDSLNGLVLNLFQYPLSTD